MDDWQPTRILMAAEFAGRYLTVRVATIARGDPVCTTFIPLSTIPPPGVRHHRTLGSTA
jgi:hypothetical protein